MSQFKPEANDGFESWIRSKNYEELNAQELEVLQQEGIDQAAYSEIRAMLLAINTLDDEPLEKPSSEIKSKLLSAFDEGPQKNRKSGLLFWIGGLGLSAAAALLIYFYILPTEVPNKSDLAIKQSEQNQNAEKAFPESVNKTKNQEIRQSAKTDLLVVDNEPSVEEVDGASANENKEEINFDEPPPLADYKEDVVHELDAVQVVAQATATSTAPVSMRQSVDFVESTMNKNIANNQHLTAAMIDWLVTVY